MAFIRSSLGTSIRVAAPDTARDTNIQWDTEGGAGRLKRSKNGGPALDWPDSNRNGSPNRANDTLAVGDVHVYHLFNLAQIELASLTVTCRRAFDPGLADAEARVTVEHLLANLGEVQQIRNLSVDAGPGHVDLKFDTTQPAIPRVEVATDGPRFFAPLNRWQFEPSQIVSAVWPGLAGARTRHTIRVRFLPARSTLYFLISCNDGDPTRRAAQRHGSFTTTSRDALVHIDRIRVHSDSDTSTDGEIGFGLQVFDGPLGPSRVKTTLSNYVSVKDGRDLPIGRSYVAQDVGDFLTVVVYGEDEDLWGINELHDFDFAWKKSDAPPGAGYGSTATVDWARAQGDFSLPDTVAGVAWEGPLELDSPHGALRFTVHGLIRVPPTAVARISDPPPPRRFPRIDYALSGRRAAAIRNGDGFDLVARGPGGTVLHTHLRREPEANGTSWSHVGSSSGQAVTVVAAPSGEILLFTVSDDGAVLHKAWTGDGWHPANDEWRSLGGGELRDRVVALQRSGAPLDLFGVAGDGGVRHRPFELGQVDDAPWTTLGGAVGSCLTPVATSEGRIELFALGRDGEVLHATMLASPRASLERPWRSLGGRFAGPLLAHSDEEGVVDLIAVDRDRRLWHRRFDAGRGDAEAADWLHVGDIDALLELRPAPLAALAHTEVHC